MQPPSSAAAPRRLAPGLAVAAAVALAACEPRAQLTRPLDPPPSSVTWLAAGLAVTLLAVVVTALIVVGLSWRARPTALRTAAGTALAAWAVLPLGLLAFVGASEARTAMILDGDGCHQIPFEDRPRQLVQLTCDPLAYSFTAVALAFLGAVTAITSGTLLAGAAALLRGRRRPWVTASLVSLPAVAGLVRVASEAGSEVTADALLLGSAGIVAALATAALTWLVVWETPASA